MKFLDLDGGGRLGRLAKEFGGEIFGVIIRVLAGEIGSGTQGEVAEAETELRIQAGKATALAIGEAMVATERFGIGFGMDSRTTEVSESAFIFSSVGVPPMKMHEYQNKGAGKIGEVERFEEFTNSGRGAPEAAGAPAR
jgi:hypothetical protein